MASRSRARSVVRGRRDDELYVKGDDGIVSRDLREEKAPSGKASWTPSDTGAWCCVEPPRPVDRSLAGVAPASPASPPTRRRCNLEASGTLRQGQRRRRHRARRDAWGQRGRRPPADALPWNPVARAWRSCSSHSRPRNRPGTQMLTQPARHRLQLVWIIVIATSSPPSSAMRSRLSRAHAEPSTPTDGADRPFRVLRRAYATRGLPGDSLCALFSASSGF